MSRRVLVLASLLLVVGGWLFFGELPILRSDADRAAEQLRLFRSVPAVVDTVRFRKPDREILLVRAVGADAGWWLRSPIIEKVPDVGVEELIIRLAGTERWRRVSPDVPDDDWSLYGLASDSPGRVRIEMIGSEGKSGLDVGLLTPGSRIVWVRRPGSPELDSCVEDLHTLANMTHHGLRDPRLFEINNSELRRIEVSGDNGDWDMARDEAGLWYLESLDGPRLKRWIIEDFAFAVAGQRVDGYLRDDLVEADWAAYGLDQPWATVEWEAADGRRGALRLGNELGGGLSFGRRARLETVFQIAHGLEPMIFADTATLVDLNPVGGNFLHALRIRVSDGEGFIDIIRESPGVRIVTEQGDLEPGEYSQVAGRNLQLGLEEFQPEAEMIVPVGRPPTASLDSVEATMVIHWPQREVRLQIGQMAGQVWITQEGEATLWQVKPDLLLRVREVLALRRRS
jgi:hypothetical protein